MSNRGWYSLCIVAGLCALSCPALARQLHLSKFPRDKAILPASLENMRPMQIVDAVSRKAPCILPVGTIESTGENIPLGMDDQTESSLQAFAKEQRAVLAPTIWYAPNGHILSGSKDGTVDTSMDDFSAFLRVAVSNLWQAGFRPVMIVPVHNPQGTESPMMAAIRFATGSIMEDQWKDPSFGQAWWAAGDEHTNSWFGSIRLVDLPKSKVDAPAKTAAKSTGVTKEGFKLPLSLEKMTPAELKAALKAGLPLFVPLGVLENHGNHNPVGVDAFMEQDTLMAAASQEPVVVGPTIWYGPTSYAVSGPKLGTLSMDGPTYEHFIASVIDGLVGIGFKDVTFMNQHQGGGALETGVRFAIQRYRCRLTSRSDFGPGWADRVKEADRPLSAHLSLIGQPGGKSDHAGRNETSWMLFLRAPYTDLSLTRPGDYPFCWYKDDESNTAKAEWGKEWLDECITNYIKLFKEKRRP